MGRKVGKKGPTTLKVFSQISFGRKGRIEKEKYERDRGKDVSQEVLLMTIA